MAFDSTSLAAGVCGGVVAGYVGLPLLPAFAESTGPVPLACAAALLSAAAVVAFRRRGVGPGPDPYPRSPPREDRPALTLPEWLVEKDLLEYGELRTRENVVLVLSAQLTHARGYRDPLYDLLVRLLVVQRMRVKLPGQNSRQKGSPDWRDVHDIFRALSERPEESTAKLITDFLRSALGSTRWGHIEYEVSELQARHAFRETALMGALEDARRAGGPLSCAAFGWLRRHDRGLWFAVQNLGRAGGYVEGLGAMSHYQAEALHGRGLGNPVVGPAVEAVYSEMRARGGRGREPTHGNPGDIGPSDLYDLMSIWGRPETRPVPAGAEA